MRSSEPISIVSLCEAEGSRSRGIVASLLAKQSLTAPDFCGGVADVGRMKTFLILIMVFVTSLLYSMEEIPNSSSPNGKLKIVLDTASDVPRYSVIDQKLNSLGVFPTDFEKRSEQMCLRSEISWRKDGFYFVIAEPQTRYNGFFIIAHSTSTGFSIVPFDIQAVLKVTGLDWHLAHAKFEHWLPKNQIEISITAETSHQWSNFEFILDLENDLKVVSWKKTD